MSTFKNQTYKDITVDCSIDLNSATSPKILYQKPNGTTGSWDATITADTKLYYEFVDGDLDVEGVWRGQGYALIDGRRIWGDIFHFKVKTPLIAEVA